jgi:hypothetical protein
LHTIDSSDCIVAFTTTSENLQTNCGVAINGPPRTVTTVPPYLIPTDGSIILRAGEFKKLNVREFDRCKLLDTNVRGTFPARCSGTKHETNLSDINSTVVDCPPKSQKKPSPFTIPEPLMVTVLPPAIVPTLGKTAEIDIEGKY